MKSPSQKSIAGEAMKYAISGPCPADLVDTHPERVNARIATTRHMFVLPTALRPSSHYATQ